MLRFFLLLLIITFYCAPVFADLDSLFNQLDAVLDKKKQYTKQKLEDIATISVPL